MVGMVTTFCSAVQASIDCKLERAAIKNLKATLALQFLTLHDFAHGVGV